MLEFSAATLGYVSDGRFTQVTHELSFSIGENVCLGLAGASGIGKSSVLRAAAGVLQPLSGAVYREGPLPPSIWYMPQSPILLPFRTTLENALLGRELGRRLLEPDLEHALSTLAGMHMGDFSGVLPEALSGGMRRRVAVAQSLLAERGLILLDEPFSELDFNTRSSVEEMVFEQIRSSSASCIIASHDVDSLVAVSDKILVLQAPSPARATLLSVDSWFDQGLSLSPRQRRRQATFAGAVASVQRAIWERHDG